MSNKGSSGQGPKISQGAKSPTLNNPPNPQSQHVKDGVKKIPSVQLTVLALTVIWLFLGLAVLAETTLRVGFLTLLVVPAVLFGYLLVSHWIG